MRQKMPKLLLLLLGFYCLFLAVLPCHCSEPEGKSHAHITSVTKQDTPHHVTDSRICTPFCICSGVHNPNFFTKNPPLLLPVAPVTDYYISYTDSVSHCCRIDIWRPPKSSMLL